MPPLHFAMGTPASNLASSQPVRAPFFLPARRHSLQPRVGSPRQPGKIGAAAPGRRQGALPGASDPRPGCQAVVKPAQSGLGSAAGDGSEDEKG